MATLIFLRSLCGYAELTYSLYRLQGDDKERMIAKLINELSGSTTHVWVIHICGLILNISHKHIKDKVFVVKYPNDSLYILSIPHGAYHLHIYEYVYVAKIVYMYFS